MFNKMPTPLWNFETIFNYIPKEEEKLNWLLRKITRLATLNTDISIGFTFTVFGIIYYLLSYSQAEGMADWSLSPGFFPRMAACFIIGLSLLLAAIGLFNKRKIPMPERQPVQYRAVMGVILTACIMFFYVYLMEWLGFVLSTSISMFTMLVYIGARRWSLIVAISIGFPFIIKYFAFKLMFVLFPAGKLFE